MSTEKAKILVVEDNMTNRLFLMSVLEDFYKIQEASNGQEAIELTSTFKPDLILMDLEMPVMNGLEACKALQADTLTQNIPVIFITAQDSTDYETTALKIGAVDYITKPINANVTLARIKLQLDLLQAQKERDDKILELEKMVRIFELKLAPKTAPNIDKPAKKIEALDEYVFSEHGSELEDLESEMDAIINIMFLSKTLDKPSLEKLSILLQSYSKILRFYPIFNKLGSALTELSLLLQNNEEELTQEYIETILTYFESLLFTLKHWSSQVINQDIKNPNMYDDSMLSDINIISLTFENKLDDIENDMEFF